MTPIKPHRTISARGLSVWLSCVIVSATLGLFGFLIYSLTFDPPWLMAGLLMYWLVVKPLTILIRWSLNL
ncbi:MAG: hypothetical protein QM766_18745 [Burkholderiaceae bacterium]